TLLLSNTCRLYYLCLLIDSYRDRIDWAQLLEKLKGKGGDRLLAAYAHYGKRELGLHLPPALEQFHQGPDDVAYLDAVVGSSQPMIDYNYRVSVAALTTPNRQCRLKKVFQDLGDIVVSHREGREAVVLGDIPWMFKVAFLQLVALLHVSIHGRRRSIFGG